MQMTTLPGTALATSRLGFGTASLHHLLRSRDRHQLLRTALDSGFTHFDTARMYGEGMAERSLGAWLTGGLRQQVTLATKFGIAAHPWSERVPSLMYTKRALSGVARMVGYHSNTERRRCWLPSTAEASLTASLRALKTDWIDLLLLHEPRVEDLVALQILTPWLQKQKASGRVRYLGLAGQAVSCLSIFQSMPNVFDVLQVEDSLTSFEANAVTAVGLPLQITYGYLRLSEQYQSASRSDLSSVLKAALLRNTSGMVLVSTRKVERVKTLAALPNEESGS